ncbi:MAG: HU family DNA-binding protein [Eubacteriales bacterium]|nr:HU family DNA-binding protein [Eubacteriales bacterium]
MIKKEFLKKIAEKSGLSEKEADLFYRAFTETVIETLKDGEKIQLVGFGTFEIGERAAREGRNPQTGESIQIGASKAPRFKAGKAFKDAVNG